MDLRCDEHRGGSNQLQFSPDDRHETEEAVDIVDGQTEGFTLQSVLLADFDQPIDKNRSHRVIDVGLLCHVVGSRADVFLELK